MIRVIFEAVTQFQVDVDTDDPRAAVDVAAARVRSRFPGTGYRLDIVTADQVTGPDLTGERITVIPPAEDILWMPK